VVSGIFEAGMPILGLALGLSLARLGHAAARGASPDRQTAMLSQPRS
jgi:hypothetical protein